MKVGGYQLHLYCDFPDESYAHRGSGEHPGPGFLEVHTEETYLKSIRVARRLGWKLGRTGELCLYCRRKGRELPRDDEKAAR